MTPFTLGRLPTSEDVVLGHTVHKIMGFTYIRYAFADEQGPFQNWYIWADILMQVQLLMQSPALLPLRLCMENIWIREREAVDLF